MRHKLSVWFRLWKWYIFNFNFSHFKWWLRSDDHAEMVLMALVIILCFAMIYAFKSSLR